ncbi:uncharacterized protein THITE_2119417 [Thermothielavioides terrestris NRRL 8126]|uniref:Life-span regulatory factor domain-containing protein n=2 Tax=Thermothielavioides terrestris TaxID=2587410 RepID=G2RBS3_THETT|nr:uncharacterized protein THITE_2119417 [Thermothielavioides terrestris NRRL 8126]AEO69244.1 hypothetical protein THITE_2119417 [Thermothielavioides terrestris NRRL 8126]
MHHHRRKSGHASGNSSLTDVRKAVGSTDPSAKKHSSRPAAMTRRTTPQSVPKLGRNPRDREKEWEEERWWDEERESFPQFCMICEKQFVPSDDQYLYCSEECRMHDLNGASISTAPSRYINGPSAPQYPLFSGPPEHRDIIPRASPSRPSSTHVSPPSTPATQSAISALKSLSIRPASPTSPTGTYHSGIWPFGRSATATSPSNSYSKPAMSIFSSTYDGAYSAAGSDYYGSSSDRPLPARRPTAYARPKSIELVTPMLGR